MHMTLRHKTNRRAVICLVMNVSSEKAKRNFHKTFFIKLLHTAILLLFTMLRQQQTNISPAAQNIIS